MPIFLYHAAKKTITFICENLKDFEFKPRKNWLYDLFKVLKALLRWNIIKNLRYQFFRYWQFHITLMVLDLFKPVIKQRFRHLLEVFPRYFGGHSKILWMFFKVFLSCSKRQPLPQGWFQLADDFNLLIFIVLIFYSCQPIAPISRSPWVGGCPKG